MKMAGKKVWRDAATLILTAKSNNVTPSVGASKKSPSANSINIYSSMFNYSVLMLKRSSKSKFMPNAQCTITEWSDWLTPTDLHEQGRRRFDTIFYQTSLQTIPTTLLDQQEVTAVQWTDPASILQQFYNKELWLAPPQVYELSKLLRFTDLDNLDRVSRDRQQHGLSTWLPVRMECQDGLLSLLPGDFMYPSDPDYIGLDQTDPNRFVVIKVTLESLENSSLFSAHAKKTVQIKYDGTMEDSRGGQNVKLNRLELNMYESSYDCVPRVSYDSEHNHIKPMTFSDFQVKNDFEI